jgi:hypothetical protein
MTSLLLLSISDWSNLGIDMETANLVALGYGRESCQKMDASSQKVELEQILHFYKDCLPLIDQT